MGARFRDADVAALKPVADQIVVADFSNTAITDHAAADIAAMKQLRELRLMHTKITDATVLASWRSGSVGVPECFWHSRYSRAWTVVEHLPKLRHFYVGETKIPVDVPVSEAVKSKLLF